MVPSVDELLYAAPAHACCLNSFKASHTTLQTTSSDVQRQPQGLWLMNTTQLCSLCGPLIAGMSAHAAHAPAQRTCLTGHSRHVALQVGLAGVQKSW